MQSKQNTKITPCQFNNHNSLNNNLNNNTSQELELTFNSNYDSNNKNNLRSLSNKHIRSFEENLLKEEQPLNIKKKYNFILNLKKINNNSDELK